MYLTHDEWLELGGSELEIQLFNRLEFRAERVIDKFTFGRISGTCVPDSIKRAMFEIIDLYRTELSDERKVQSMSNDGVQVTYEASKDAEARAAEIVRDFLPNELLYRGV